jgi:hypothetical protein
MVDHDREIREAWSGDSDSVKRSLRYVLQDVLGLDATDYAWWWQAEPHPGDGDAAGYSHAHPIVVLDAAAAGRSADEIQPETFRPVVEKHVEQCDGAKPAAHKITDDEKSAVKVNQPDEIDELAQYVSKYLAVGPDQDLLERSDEYLLWAASQWATSTQKYSKSETATAVIDADRCQQEWLDPEAEQDRRHGESVVPAPDAKQKRGIKWVCSECGSHHGIKQSEESLVRMRLDERETADTPTVAADGGKVVSADAMTGDGDATDESDERTPLRGRWPDATAAASIGAPTRERDCGHEQPDTCPLCATETEAPDHTVSGETPIPADATAPDATTVFDHFQREPSWRPEAIVQAWDSDDDGTAIGEPGGTCYGEVVVEGAGSITAKSCLSYLPPAATLRGPEPWESTDAFTEADVRAGRVPPAELVERETAETVQSGRRITEKEWSNDWYAERYEQPATTDADEFELADADADRIRDLVRTESISSPVAICGRLSINPKHTDAVADIVAEHGTTK